MSKSIDDICDSLGVPRPDHVWQFGEVSEFDAGGAVRSSTRLVHAGPVEPDGSRSYSFVHEPSPHALRNRGWRVRW